jgi:hypothetical protein
MMTLRLSRRHVLRGLGLAGLTIALPPLEAMRPRLEKLRAQETFPMRFVLFHFPNGAHMEDWIPDAIGAGYDLTAQLMPLADLRADFNVVSGLSNLVAEVSVPGLDGGHHNSNLSFMTGTVGNTSGASSISVDQEAANHLGGATSVPSIVASTFVGPGGGLYNDRPSWRGAGAPVSQETDPQALFDLAFAGSGIDTGALARLRERRQSVLDFVMSDIDDLDRRLGADDRARIDQHLTAVRELERNVAALRELTCSLPARPGATPEDDSMLGDRANLLVDLVVMALRCDVTRVAYYGAGTTNNTRTYPFLGAPYQDHEISHYRAVPGDDAMNRALYRVMTTWKIEQFARMLRQLRDTPEGDARLLDHCVVTCASEMSNGDWHSEHNLPVLVAGGGMTGGRHIRFPCDQSIRPTGGWCADTRNTPLSNLWLTMLQAVGAPVASFGDSTGTLSDLWI